MEKEKLLIIHQLQFAARKRVIEKNLWKIYEKKLNNTDYLF